MDSGLRRFRPVDGVNVTQGVEARDGAVELLGHGPRKAGMLVGIEPVAGRPLGGEVQRGRVLVEVERVDETKKPEGIVGVLDSDALHKKTVKRREVLDEIGVRRLCGDPS